MIPPGETIGILGGGQLGRMLALAAAFLLSLTFVPAMVALLIRGKVAEKEVWAIAKIKSRYEPVLRQAVAKPWPFIGAGVAAFALAGVLFTTLGQEFIPKRADKLASLKQGVEICTVG